MDVIEDIQAKDLKHPLALACYMAEDLEKICQQPDQSTAAAVPKDCFGRASSPGIIMLMKMAKTRGFNRHGILPCYDYPISTGTLENPNSKIKTMKRQPDGFEDLEFFTVKILAFNETRYALVG